MIESGQWKSFMESRRNRLVCLALAAITIAAYWQVATFEFTNFDEFQMVLQNPFVLAGVTPRGLWWALTTSWFEYWHPLTWMSHMLDCELFGLNAGGHHLMSAAIHVANTVLLYLVLERMTGAWKRSAMVAALFALHPLHVESVAWIAERKDVLSGLFFLLTLFAYAGYAKAESGKQKAESGKQKAEIPEPSGVTDHASRITYHASRITDHASRSYLLSLAFFACGLMSKPMVVTLPFVLLLLDVWPLRRLPLFKDQRSGFKVQRSSLDVRCSMLDVGCSVSSATQRLVRLLVEKLPFFALSLASCVITYFGARAGGNVLSSSSVPWGLRLENVPVSYARYLGKLIWPTNLIPMYPMPTQIPWWQVAGATVLLVMITLVVLRKARSAPYGVVGWLLFLGMLIPTIGVVQVGQQSIADRYTYLPYVGLFIAVVWGMADWVSNHRGTQIDTDDRDEAPEAVPAAANSGWSCPELPGTAPSQAVTLAAAPSGCLPNLCSSVLIWGSVFGVLLAAFGYLSWRQIGTWRNSTALWTHCLAVSPDNLFGLYNLGYVQQHSGKTSEAIELYRATLRVKPSHVDANLNLGIALIGIGKSEEATNHLATALRVKPGYARAEGAMGLALYQLHDYTGAVAHCSEAIRLDPEAFGPYVDMGRALSAQNKSDEALRYFAEGLRLNPGLAQSHYYLGLEWMKRREYGQAARSFGEAVRLAPTWKGARDQWEQALARQAALER